MPGLVQHTTPIDKTLKYVLATMPGLVQHNTFHNRAKHNNCSSAADTIKYSNQNETPTQPQAIYASTEQQPTPAPTPQKLIPALTEHKPAHTQQNPTPVLKEQRPTPAEQKTNTIAQQTSGLVTLEQKLSPHSYLPHHSKIQPVQY